MNSKEALEILFASYNFDGNYHDLIIAREKLEQDLDRLEQLESQIKDGTLSDGYHTFNDLYLQRMYLFATIVNQNKELAWKSLKHEDGELCFGGDWFIVGIDTPKGSYTYHYETNYWSLFDCQELEVAKHWDGHTSKDVGRLLSLENKLEKENQELKKEKDIALEKSKENWAKYQKECDDVTEYLLVIEKKNEELIRYEKALDILKEKLDIKLEIYHNGGCTLNHKIISNCVTSNERCLRYLEVEEYELLKSVLEEE